MGTAAMDALKYGSYMSGLYGTMATSSTTSTDPTNTTSTGQPGNKSPYMQQQELSPTDKGYPESNNGSASSASLKNYSADSLSRSYFDASRYNEAAAKSYTPDSLNGGRASAESPDAMKQQQMMQNQQQTADLQQQTAVPQQQQMGFNSLQAYYSQHGMGAAAAAGANNVTGPNTAPGPGSLPPFLPMAAQLSQYSVAASAAASAAAAANTNYAQSTPPGGANSEYRRPLSVLF